MKASFDYCYQKIIGCCSIPVNRYIQSEQIMMITNSIDFN